MIKPHNIRHAYIYMHTYYMYIMNIVMQSVRFTRPYKAHGYYAFQTVQRASLPRKIIMQLN